MSQSSLSVVMLAAFIGLGCCLFLGNISWNLKRIADYLEQAGAWPAKGKGKS